jgi:hypothetical protein
MVPVILAVLLSLFALPAWAAIRYVDPTAGTCGTYSIALRDCSGTDGNSYATFALALVPTVAGDTVYWRSGTYTTRIALGSKTGAAGSYITIAAYPGETVTIRPSVEGHFITQSCGTGYFIIDGFVFDGSLLPVPTSGNGTSGVVFMTCDTGVPEPHHFTYKNNIMKNIPRHVFLIIGEGHRIQNNTIYDNRSDCGAGRRFYGIYAHHGNDIIIENNEIYNTAGGYMQVYPGPWTNAVIRKNYFHDNTWCGTASFGGIIGGNVQGVQFYNNISAHNGSAPGAANGTGLTISGVTGTPQDTLVRNNTFYGNQTQGIAVVNISSNPLRTILENNLSVGNGGANISVTAGAVTTVQTTNKTTGAITDYTLSTSDFSLKAGSPCIDFGTARSGFPYNGSAPDCGAFESIPNPTASITTNKITLIYPMNLNVPIQHLSTLGVLPVCFGSACPVSPTATAVSRVVGTDAHIEIVVGGITGNACESADQTWELDYDSSVGTWSDSANIGVSPGINQKTFSFVAVSVVNQCTGSPAASYPAGYHIFYKFNENTGTNANDESANNLDCTFTNSPTWGAGKTLYAMVAAAGSTQHCAIPWGSGVNPYSTDLTIVAPVEIAAGTESGSHYVFGPSHGTNQRFYVCSHQGTWRISYQAVTCPNTSASSLAVTSGWNHLIVRTNSATHVATLYKDGIAGTGGAAVTLTSYTLASNLTYGRVGSLASSGGTYDDFLVYLSLEDPVDIFNAFQGIAVPLEGMVAQAAVQAQGVTLDASVPWNVGSLNSAVEVVRDGGVAFVFQVHCQNITDCDPTAFKLVYAVNQTAAAAASAGTLTQVPNSPTSDGIFMWGETGKSGENTEETTTRLTGSCTVTNGTTQITADQVPNVDLPQDGCVMLRYLVRIASTVAADTYFELRLLTQAGLPLDGGYAADARITVVPPRASGIGF